jgi:hypothetical protein
MGGILGTALVLIILALIIGLIVFSMVKDKKQGKSSCSCGGSCGCCPNSAACHGSKQVKGER